ncbi:MAG: Ppx/GppA family phosphatase, partial [Pseudomonadota bacterium]
QARAARNFGEERRTGLELEVVDRETEARLAVSGCGSLVDREAKSTVLFDIGGGSSEIAVIDLAKTRSRRLADGITAWTSLPVGVVTMAERFGGEHVNEEIFADMKAYAAELLEPFSNDHGRVGGDDPSFHLIGTSGTVTTLAGIHLGLPRYDRRRVDGLWISGDDVETINNRILNWSFDERKANPCIGEDRADLVLAGCAILEAIRDVWPAKRLRVADRGLREGLLTEMMNEDGVWRSRKKRRRRPHNNNAHATTQNPGSAKPRPS